MIYDIFDARGSSENIGHVVRDYSNKCYSITKFNTKAPTDVGSNYGD